MKCGWQMVVSLILLASPRWLQPSLLQLTNKMQLTIPRSRLSGEGAVGVVGAVVPTTEVEEVPEEAEPGIPTIIKIKIKLTKQVLIIHPTPNHIKGVPSILTYLPVLAGPVLSIGSEAAKLLTALIPSSVSGSR